MIDRPTFRQSRRGYEPADVDEFISQLDRTVQAAKRDASERSVELARINAVVTDLKSQLAALEATPAAPPSGYTELGERMTSILTLAEAEAQELRSAAATAAQQATDEASRRAERLRTSTTSWAEATRARATEDATQILTAARAEAEALISDAQAQAAAIRSEAQAELESHRARATAAAAELESSIAARQGQADTDFEARRRSQEAQLADASARSAELLALAQREADELRDTARARAQAAETEADRLVAEARTRAQRVREESDREIAAAAERRDRINEQLTNVRRMLGALGVENVEGPDAAVPTEGADEAGQAAATVTKKLAEGSAEQADAVPTAHRVPGQLAPTEKLPRVPAAKTPSRT